MCCLSFPQKMVSLFVRIFLYVFGHICPLRCFVTVGWVTERASDLEKISSAIPPTVLLWRLSENLEK